MNLNIRLKKSGEALEILKSLTKGGVPLGSRIELTSRRLQILKELKANVSDSAQPDIETNVSAVVDSGKKVLEKLGISFTEDYKAIISDRLKRDSMINQALNKTDWSESKINRVRDKISVQSRAYDIYRIAEADRRPETFDVYRSSKSILDSTYFKIGINAMEVVDHLKESSPVSRSEAKDKVSSQNMKRGAKERISKQRKGDYRGKAGHAKFNKDLTDLFQLTAFNGEPITFDVHGDRAFYSESHREINIGKGLEKWVLWHEIAHSIEMDNPEVLEMSKNFLKERLAKSNGIKTLRSIYTDKWGSSKGVKYDRKETAIDDGTFTPYVAKFYNESNPTDIDGARATEVISMGIEALSNPQTLGQMIAQDIEHFYFILGVVKHLQGKANATKGGQ